MIGMKLKSFSDLNRLLPDSAPSSHAAYNESHNGKAKTVRVSLETKGRKGKSVTIVSGLQHNPATMKEIARILKEQCGAGGTVKENNIELQGDQRARATAKLQEMNYVVTKA